MGYHDGGDIPNYSAMRGLSFSGSYVRAERVVEFAGAFVSVFRVVRQMHHSQRSLELHKFARQTGSAIGLRTEQAAQDTVYAWTDLTYLMHKRNVSSADYIVEGAEPDRKTTRKTARPFLRMRRRREFGILCPSSTLSSTMGNRNRPAHHQFRQASESGDLPAVSWSCRRNR